MNLARVLVVAGTIFLASSFTWLLAAPSHLGGPFKPENAAVGSASVPLWTPPDTGHRAPGTSMGSADSLALAGEFDRQHTLALVIASFLRHANGNAALR